MRVKYIASSVVLLCVIADSAMAAKGTACAIPELQSKAPKGVTILSAKANPLKEKMAILLLLEKEKQSFLFFLRNYIQSQRLIDNLDMYLMKKFGMDHQSFPYMQELQAISGEPEKLEALLEKVTLGQ